ncbi:aspartate/glutamate racemase family protein [Sulfurospirillum barnesii]|uniref:Aspartate racemase n=1 Tax=Sulfurospirillum barnesii (strain ATCC 700032 / DSM 10660 / SES-3) TaxID=760154 RepID=I3XTX6_SULBS|nr:aspartate/glutamate racemase family protein [Sulfurospirillum barnesii]AFL67400.1 aspartate racemase [Sulfurospirillum barnesii SES-3]
MKTIGLIGGMSWESTLSYYTLLNEGVKANLGGLHSAKVILYSVDFAPIAAFQKEGRWEEAAHILQEAALSLERAGADFILLCTNTMHKILPLITPHISIPFLHIAEATAEALKEKGAHKAILLGTKFTLQERFYTDILHQHNIDVVIPDEQSIQNINRIIFDELCVGKIKTDSQKLFLTLINTLKKDDKSIDSVILGCTEIGLLLDQKMTDLPLFDTTLLHVNAALKYALKTT